MKVSYDYKFNADYNEIIACDAFGGMVAKFSLVDGNCYGKRGSVLKNVPDAFRRRFLLSKLQNNETLVIYTIINKFNSDRTWCINWLKSNPSFNIFLSDFVKLPRSIILDTISMTLYQQFNNLGRDNITDEDLEFITQLHNLNISLTNYAKLFNNKDTINDFLEHPIIRKGISGLFNKSLPATCTKQAPSLDWYIAILNAIIADGFDENTCFSAINSGYVYEFFSCPRLFDMIDTYYNNLVFLNEYSDEPITDGFFTDYARTIIAKESAFELIYQEKLNKCVNFYATGTAENDNWKYTSVENIKQLKRIANFAMSSGGNLTSLKNALNAGVRPIIAENKENKELCVFAPAETISMTSTFYIYNCVNCTSAIEEYLGLIKSQHFSH